MWDETVQKVVGLNPGTVDWIDIFPILFVVKILMFVRNDKNKWKEPGHGPFIEKIQKYAERILDQWTYLEKIQIKARLKEQGGKEREQREMMKTQREVKFSLHIIITTL